MWEIIRIISKKKLLHIHFFVCNIQVHVKKEYDVANNYRVLPMCLPATISNPQNALRKTFKNVNDDMIIDN